MNIFFPVELWRFRHFFWTLSSHVFGVWKAASKKYPTLEFGFCCGLLARFSCCVRRCTMTFAFWRPQRWIKNSVQGLLWNFLIDFGKPSIHSTSLVDHFRGLLAPHFVQTSLRGGVWGQKSRQSQGPRRSLWGLLLGVWLRVHKAWASAGPGVGSL